MGKGLNAYSLKRAAKLIIFAVLLAILCGIFFACTLDQPNSDAKFRINDNKTNQRNKDNTSRDEAIERTTDSITNLREYLNNPQIATTGYYMGMEFNIDTINPATRDGWNFTLKIQADLYTYQYIRLDAKNNEIWQYFDKDESHTVREGSNDVVTHYWDEQNANATRIYTNHIWKFYDKRTGQYFDVQNDAKTREPMDAEDIHNEVIKKSDIKIEWYNGAINKMLIGLYYDGVNNNAADPGNILYVNIQDDFKRSFYDFGDTVLYRQLIRLLMALSVEGLLTAGNIQGDAGVSAIATLLTIAVTENYKVVLNSPVTSLLFYGIDASLIGEMIDDMLNGVFGPFENKLDPLTNKYLGFRFSEVANVKVQSAATDMQFFCQPEPGGVKEIMTGAYLTFNGVAKGSRTPALFNYAADVKFEYDVYKPIVLDRAYYTKFENGKHEFKGNLWVPMLNSNFDALIRTNYNGDLDRNAENNVFMEFRDKANGELMIGIYYRGSDNNGVPYRDYDENGELRSGRLFIDISGLEYMYGWIDLNQLGFPKVWDCHLNLSQIVHDVYEFIDDTIVSIVDAILDPDKSDKKNYLLERIMDKMRMTEKIAGDIFSKNTETLTVDITLIKQALYETGAGTFTTRQLIDIIDSMMPYTMDQIAIMLGISSAEVMVENTYFEFTLNVDTNEITIEMFTNVGVKKGDPSILVFRLDLICTKFGSLEVFIADINFNGFKPLDQIYTYSGTLRGSFIFSAAETVDLSKLLSATIGENSGLNTPYILSQKAGLSFELIYDQFVLDQTVDGVLKRAGRSAFQLTVWLTGWETSVIIRLASDDVAFDNEVYSHLPERARDLGWVWVSIECVTEKGGIQKIPKVKVREDIFMASMQAYMDGTSISDDAAKLGDSEINLSLTSIIFALLEDSYVVPEPTQLEITTSNETVQSLFRVKGLIGNIRVNAGFRYRVKGLESIKNDYGMYNVAYFNDMLKENSPYDTVLQDTVPVYFYDDYHEDYLYLDYDIRIDRKTGVLNVYEKGARVTIQREAIDYPSDSFFLQESANNQDISKTKFNAFLLIFYGVITEDNGRYYYYDYDGVRKGIDQSFVQIDANTLTVYIFYEGISERVHHLEDADFYFFDQNRILYDANNKAVQIEPNTRRDMLFEYDELSIEITEAAKTQYAPRINGSFMGEIRRYFLVFTAANPVERGKLVGLGYDKFYSEEDRENVHVEYDDDGVEISREPMPIVLFVFEPFLPIETTVKVKIAVGFNIEDFELPARFILDESLIDVIDGRTYFKNDLKKGLFLLTEVIVAEGTMGEKRYPVRIIVTNREISAIENVGVYTSASSSSYTTGVPVVYSIEIDPYDYMLTKYDFFTDIANFYAGNYSNDQFMAAFEAKEAEFVRRYFSNYAFTITFDYEASDLYTKGTGERDPFTNALIPVKTEYIAKQYSNAEGGVLTTKFDWDFDACLESRYREEKISASGATLYLHTYFEGQLIALKVVVGQRKFSHLKFSEDDDFNPDVENFGKTDTNELVYGHYVANYFDEASYEIPRNPIFVFVDERTGRTYERTFNMTIVTGLDASGNYVFNNAYALTWGDPVITNIGSNGSYYYVGTTLVNRPFYIWNGIRNENGEIVEEYDPIETGNPTDLDTSTLNLFYLFRIFRPIHSGAGGLGGAYTGEYNVINILAGTADDHQTFPTILLRVTVECPKLEVAHLTTPVADEKDGGANFIPTKARVGTSPLGYYYVDPHNAASKKLPTDITVYFFDPDNPSMEATHVFKNVEWFARFIPSGDTFIGSYVNASGVQTLRLENGFVYFNLSTEESFITKITARIGSQASGYEYIEIALKVLSKDPQAIEFFRSAPANNENKIGGIEDLGMKVKTGEAKAEEYIVYTYYANTFAEFTIPKVIKAYFDYNDITGAFDRFEIYNVTWKLVSNTSAVPSYVPNSVLCLYSTIGDDVQTNIYLIVVVENYVVNKATVSNDMLEYYVRVGSAYVQLKEFNKTYVQGADKLLELSIVQNSVTSYVHISTGLTEDNGVPIGMIGLFTKQNPAAPAVLVEKLYPYDFITRFYKTISVEYGEIMNINGQDEYVVKPVDDKEFILDYNVTVTTPNNSSQRIRKLSLLTAIVFSYDEGMKRDGVSVEFFYEESGVFFYPVIRADGRIELTDPANISASLFYNPQELASLVTRLYLGEDIYTLTVIDYVESTGVHSPSAPFAGKTLKDMIIPTANGFIIVDPVTNDVITNRLKSIVLSDGSVMDKEELLCRLNYLRKHREIKIITNDRQKAKQIEIDNLEGIFSVNDVLRDNDGVYTSTKYFVSLGSQKGAFDLTVRLIFNGGINLDANDRSEGAAIEIDPYSLSGMANFGAEGFVMSSRINATLRPWAQDGSGRGGSDDFAVYNYGELFGMNTPKLVKWYVETSTTSLIAVHTFITSIPQSLIYARTPTTIVISTLTVEGFRITRRIVISALSAEINVFDSTNSTGLKIVDGVIRIDDLYNYLPLMSTLGDVLNLPNTVRVNFGTESNPKFVTISNVAWRITTDWANRLNGMTFDGTSSSPYIMATAMVLGYEVFKDGIGWQTEAQVPINLRIVVPSAKVVELPWITGAIKLDTLTLNESSTQTGKIFYVEIDALNDMNNTLLSGGYFNLPTSEIAAQYQSGLVHYFRNVEYYFGGRRVARIPYTNAGIDIEKLADELGVPLDWFTSRLHIDLNVDVISNLDLVGSARQTLTIRFNFYDKRAINTTPVITVDLSGNYVRNELLTAFKSVRADKENEIFDDINLTRMRLNVESLIEQAAVIRNNALTLDANLLIPMLNQSNASALISSYLQTVLSNVTYEIDGGGNDYSTDPRYNFTGADAGTYGHNFVSYRLLLKAQQLSLTYAALIIAERSKAPSVQLNNVTQHVKNFLSALWNEGYDLIIGDYVKWEAETLLVNQMIKDTMTSAELRTLGNQFKYRSALEAAFDVDAVIREVYKVRLLYATSELRAAQYNSILTAAFNKAISAADLAYPTNADVRSIIISVVTANFNSKKLSAVDFMETTVKKADLRRKLWSFVTSVYDLYPYLAGDSPFTGAATQAERRALVSPLIASLVASTAELSSNISSVRVSIAVGVSPQQALSSIFTNAIRQYVDTVYAEGLIVGEIRKLQTVNTLDGYYFIDPYNFFRLLPTAYVVDFDEATGGHSYYVPITAWTNQAVLGAVKYSGNGKEEAYGYMAAWDGILDEFASDVASYFNLMTLYQAAVSDVCTVSLSGGVWNEADKITWTAFYNASAEAVKELLNLVVKIARGGEENPELTDLEKMAAYKRYLAGYRLYTTATSGIFGSGLGEEGMRLLELFYASSRYPTLNVSSRNVKTNETQTLTMITRVEDKTAVRVEIFYSKDFYETAVNTVTVDDPFLFSVMINGLSSNLLDLSGNKITGMPDKVKIWYVRHDGTLLTTPEIYDIYWLNYQVTPNGNLAQADKTVRGYVAGPHGQEISVKLIVNRWEFVGIRKIGASGNMDPINFYFCEMLSHSSEDAYNVFFNVITLTSLTGTAENAPILKSLEFYPRDSKLLVDGQSDAEMRVVRMRKNYILYWDDTQRTRALNTKSQGLEGSFSLGNSRGNYNIASIRTSNAPSKAYYNYERMYVNEINLVYADTSTALSYGIADMLYGLGGQATVVIDVDSVFPMTGDIKLFERNISYDKNELAVRYLWNKTYERTISDLARFVEYAYPDIDPNARNSFALNLLMDLTRSVTETERLIDLATAYYLTMPNYTQASARRDAKQLLMLDEKYTYAQSAFFRGGANSNYKITVLVRVGKAGALLVQEFTVKVLFADYTPIAYYTARPNGGYEDKTDFFKQNPNDTDYFANYAPVLYIATRLLYFDLMGTQNQYVIEHKNPPYDNLTDINYRLLQYHSDVKRNKAGAVTVYNSGVAQTLYLTRVTNIEFEKDDKGNFVIREGRIRSVSFYIDGVKYNSDLINLKLS